LVDAGSEKLWELQPDGTTLTHYSDILVVEQGDGFSCGLYQLPDGQVVEAVYRPGYARKVITNQVMKG
jgi:hypothetical protein